MKPCLEVVGTSLLNVLKCNYLLRLGNTLPCGKRDLRLPLPGRSAGAHFSQCVGMDGRDRSRGGDGVRAIVVNQAPRAWRKMKLLQ